MFATFKQQSPSVQATVVGGTIALLTCLAGLIPLYFDNKALALIVFALGFILFYASSVAANFFQQVEILKVIKEMHDDAQSMHAESVGWSREFYSEKWCRAVLGDLAVVLRDTAANVHTRSMAKRLIESNVAFLKARSSQPELREFPKDQEHPRMMEIQLVVRVAERSIHAVTLDVGTYFVDFWGKDDKFVKDYLLGHGTNIVNERVFVLGPDVYDGQNKNKCEIVRRIVDHHQRFHIGYSLVPLSDLPAHLKSHDTSFLVCDGIVTSESYSLSDDGKRPGYVAVNDRDRAQRLSTIYDELKSCRKEPSWISSNHPR